jgi:hypothetical protein
MAEWASGCGLLLSSCTSLVSDFAERRKNDCCNPDRRGGAKGDICASLISVMDNQPDARIKMGAVADETLTDLAPH